MKRRIPPKGECGGENDTQSQGESLKVKTAGGKRNHSTNLDEQFERFWAAYPRKVNKQAALKAWNKLKPDRALTDKMLCSLDNQKKTIDYLIVLPII
ncbi:MAG: hypothetical protein K2K57_06005 [Oscillospiraceae bacterium]|nr:hypothetical protein [Oscillospiraceae bacterium]